jgi:stage II sporulation protein D
MLRAVALLTVALLAPPAWGEETLRIALEEGVPAVTVRGAHLVMGPEGEEGGGAPVDGGRASVRRVGERLEVNGVPLGGEGVRFRAAPPADAPAAPGRGLLVAGSRTVRGEVVVRRARHGLLVVNVLGLEDYLSAMVGAEMPVSFPAEALKAQAVAARTYALHKKLAAYGAPYHLGSSVLHQVYSGVGHEDPRSREAVEATRGEVLTWDLAPIEAYFHASCGGRTERGLDALGRDLPYLASVPCGCGRLPASRWQLSLTGEDLRRALGAAAAGGGEGERLRILERTGTGRARAVELAPGRRVDAVTFRQRLGYGRLRSLHFEVAGAAGGGALRLEGRGFGHGAGMCQWGARAAAQDGWDYRRILGHYYPGAELQRLY